MEAGMIRTVVLREHAPYDLLVELDAKGVRDLLGDARSSRIWDCGVSSSGLRR